MEKKRKRHVHGEFIVSAVLVLIIIGGVFFAYRWDAHKRKNIAGTYACNFPLQGRTEKEVKVFYRFDAEKGTYEEVWGDSVLMTGTYTVDGDTITGTTDGNKDIGAQSETEVFLVRDNKYLIPKNFIYEGTIPDGDTFDAECVLKDSSGTEYTVRFKKDGSFTYTAKGSSEDDDGSGTTGTYEREGDFLHRSNTDGVPMADYYIYDGKLAGFVYTKE